MRSKIHLQLFPFESDVQVLHRASLSQVVCRKPHGRQLDFFDEPEMTCVVEIQSILMLSLLIMMIKVQSFYSLRSFSPHLLLMKILDVQILPVMRIQTVVVSRRKAQQDEVPSACCIVNSFLTWIE